jgi:hypothetical protein
MAQNGVLWHIWYDMAQDRSCGTDRITWLRMGYFGTDGITWHRMGYCGTDSITWLRVRYCGTYGMTWHRMGRVAQTVLHGTGRFPVARRADCYTPSCTSVLCLRFST